MGGDAVGGNGTRGWVRGALAACALLLGGAVGGAAALAGEAGGYGAGQQPAPLWTLGGFDRPESALYDPAREAIYLSNLNGEPLERNGQGYLSRISPDGQLIDRHWVTGLNAPKGLALHQGRLYVADIDTLVVVDAASGRIIARHHAPEAQFLNDVTVDWQGRVIVSDMLGDALYRLEGETFRRWLASPALDHPNGVLAQGDRVLVATWGAHTMGHMVWVNLDDGAMADLGEGEFLGNLDGLVSDGADGYWVTDYMAGVLRHVGPHGHGETVLTLHQGTADLGVIPKRHLLLIPIMATGELVAQPAPAIP